MGVMACARWGCDNILCHHYSFEFGYLCDSCLRELIDYCVVKGSASEYTITEFLQTQPGDAIYRDDIEKRIYEMYSDGND